MNFSHLALVLIVPLLVPVSSTDNNTNKTWLLKCCDFNQIIKDKGCALGDAIDNFKVPLYEDDHVTRASSSSNVGFLFFPIRCIDYGEEYYLKLKPDVFPGQELFVQNDGMLWVSKINASFTNRQFYLEYNEGFGLSAYVCIPGYDLVPEDDKISKGFIGIGMTVSVPFLLATFVVYALLPERNLHGMCLMSYVFALFWGCALTSFWFIYFQFARKIGALTCVILGMLVYFFFQLSFFWMNVIAFDIWLTFSGNKKNSRSKMRTFLKYSIYAWGMSLLFVILVITLSNTVSPTAWYNPGLRQRECWIRGAIPLLLYWYGPLAILTIINITLFSLTAWKIRQTRQQTAVLREEENRAHNSENEAKQSFYLYLKLLLAMGVNGLFDVLPIVIDMIYQEVPIAVWYLGHFCNAAYGVFIFFMFVFKRSIWKSLKKRGCPCRRQTTTTTAAT